MSPEIYTPEEAYGFEVDMWAFGILFFYLLNMEYPFSKPFIYLETNAGWPIDKKHD